MIKNIYDYDLSALNIPEVCPVCGGDLEVQENGQIRCINESCPQKVSHKIQKFFDTLDIKGAGPAYTENASKDCKGLFDYLEAVTKSDVESCKWAGGVNGTKVASKVTKALEKEIPLEKFIACFDIESVGEGQIKKILEANEGADLDFLLHSQTPSTFLCFGIGDELAGTIFNGLKNAKEEIENCLQFFKIGKKEEKITDGVLSGLSFCFTGAMAYKRADLEKMVVDNGGTISSVNKTLSYLVQADPNSTSSKSEKARKFGTKVISPEEFLGMLK